MKRRNFLSGITASPIALSLPILPKGIDKPMVYPIDHGNFGVVNISISGHEFTVEILDKQVNWDKGGTEYKTTFAKFDSAWVGRGILESTIFVPVSEVSHIIVRTKDGFKWEGSADWNTVEKKFDDIMFPHF